MTAIPVRCTEPGCDGSVPVPKSLYDDHDVLVGLQCSRGQRFDYEKRPDLGTVESEEGRR